MAIEIRTIDEADVAGWVRCMATGFLIEPTETEAEDRRRGMTLDRTWAAIDQGQVVGTLRSFASTITVPGPAPLSTAALTNVTVAPTHRRRGLLSQMMTRDLRQSAERGEPVGMLIASEYPIYGRFGYGAAIEGATWSIDASLARFRREATGTVELVDPTTLAKEGPPIYERFQAGQPGAIERTSRWWDRILHQPPAPASDGSAHYQAVYRSPAGDHEGYVRYRATNHWDQMRPAGSLTVEDLVAVTPEAYHRLWRYCCEVDLITRVEAPDRSVDEQLAWLVADGRVVRQTGRFDFVWLRMLDVGAALSTRRYLAPGRVVIEVVDPLGLAGGRYLLDGGPDHAGCRPAGGESADLTVGVDGLGSVFAGGVSLQTLASAGRVDEHRPGAVATADAMFRSHVTPWCGTWF